MTSVAYRFTLCSPLAISTGRPGTATDATLPRLSDGRPYIPATAVKGAARLAATQALLSASARPAAAPATRELLVATFGDERSAGLLHFQAAIPVAGAETATRTMVKLTDVRVADEGALTAVEALLPLDPTTHDEPVVLSGSVSMLPHHTADPLAAPALGCALIGIAAISSFGLRTSRGLGQVAPALPEADADEYVKAALERIEAAVEEGS